MTVVPNHFRFGITGATHIMSPRFSILSSATISCLAFSALSCGQQTEVVGAVAGHSLEVKEAIYTRAQGPLGDSIVLTLADAHGLCSKLKAGASPSSFTGLTLAAVHQGPTNGSFVGEYPVIDERSGSTPPSAFGVAVFSNGASCAEALDDKGVSKNGRLTLSRFESPADERGALEGSFDIAFGPQLDQLNGNFVASFCDYEVTSSSPGTCQ